MDSLHKEMMEVKINKHMSPTWRALRGGLAEANVTQQPLVALVMTDVATQNSSTRYCCAHSSVVLAYVHNKTKERISLTETRSAGRTFRRKTSRLQANDSLTV